MRKNPRPLKNTVRFHLHTNPFNAQIRMLTGSLEESGYYLSKEKLKLNRHILFDKFGYSPSNLDLLPNHEGRLDSVDILHQGIHVLTHQRYPGKMKYRPQMVVFNECLGMGLEYLILATFLNSYPNRKNCPMAGVELSSVRLGRDFRPLLLSSLSNPFKMYKKIVLTGEKICWKFIDESIRVSKTKRFNPQRLLKTLLKIPEFIFIADVNFVGIALYIRSYCGEQSSRQDRQQRNECAALLRKSKSFAELIANLKAQE